MKASSSRSRRRQSGQILPIAAAGFLVLAAIAGLAIDASRDYLVKRDAQNAVDFAALAAAKEMTLSGNVSVALASGSAPVVAAHDFAANNGFSTNYNTACDSTVGGAFTTSWFDVTGLPCGATSGFTNKVSVNSPAVALPGSPVPTVCTGNGQYGCVQVVITTSVAELFTSVLGVKSVYITVGGTAQAILPGSNINAPTPDAPVLYQPQSGCDGSGYDGTGNGNKQQCFDESKPVARALMTCANKGGLTNNCPTFWARSGTKPSIYGYNGQYFVPASDLNAVQSNGDLVVQDRTTLCDPYGGATCSAGAVVGAHGFALPGGSKVYCSKYGTGAVISTPCTTTGQATLNELDASQGTFLTPTYWAPIVDTTKLTNCGSLILNGGPVPSGPCYNAAEPYLIEPGIYSYIVVNHGTYEFDQGLYDITGVAPVNTAVAGFANGIDHSRETAASDFDLCTGGTVTSCGGAEPLTAGVWFGRGSLSFSPYVAPTSGSCAGGFSGASGGGGDPTIIGGNAVVFRLESGSGGFVSTHEVQSLNIAGAGVNSLASVSGSPLAIDEENSSFIHLDATPGSNNQLQGIIYQTSSAFGGGVEVNLGMNNAAKGSAILGQVLAYSFTTFGTPGLLDFSQGYGAGTVPGIQTSGKNETSIISSVSLAAGAPGYEVLTVNYTDEWAMDAYDQFIKVNNGQPTFFSQGIWNPAPLPNATLPPANNIPSDITFKYPWETPSSNYTMLSTKAKAGPYASPASADWVYNIPSSNGSSIELNGQWIWGHENNFPQTNPPSAPYFAASGSNLVTVKYTFPIPIGTYVAVTVFVSDGDRCGDYAYASHTFANVGAPGPGQQTVGTVSLVQ